MILSELTAVKKIVWPAQKVMENSRIAGKTISHTICNANFAKKKELKGHILENHPEIVTLVEKNTEITS